MLYGNATATAASTLNTFNGPYSATDQVASGASGGATNSQRGFRFSPNHNIIISQFGKREPNGSTRYVTIFDFNTQAIVQQTQVAGPAATYSYSNLSSPIWLNKNQQYLLQLYQGSTDGYYFGASSQINSNLTYYDMKYCNSCTQNTFPTSTLNNYHYGYPDFQFYTCDTNNITTAPTVVVGAGGGVGISSHPVSVTTCSGCNASFSVTASGASSYQWQLNTGSGWSNITNGGIYTNATTSTLNITGATTGISGNQYRCYVVGACGNGSSNIATLSIAAPAKGLHFDGVDDYVSIPSTTGNNFTVNQNFTVAVWVKIPSAPQPYTTYIDNSIVEKWDANTGGYPYVIRYYNQTAGVNAGKVTFIRFNGSAVSSIISTMTLNDDQWHHIAAVKTGTQIQLYIDGALNGSATDISTGTTTNTSAVYLGRRGNTFYNWFNGTIDELSIWDRALCRGEILNNINCELNPSGQSNLTGLYSFNNGYVNSNNAGLTTLADASAGANNGTLNNFGLTGLTSNWTNGWATGSCSAYVPLAATATNSSPVSIGNSLTLNSSVTGTNSTSPVSYTWSGPGLTNTTTGNTSLAVNPVTGLNGGVYTVTATALGCSTTATTTVNVNASALHFNGWGNTNPSGSNSSPSVYDYVSVTDNGTMDLTGNYTLEGWVYLDDNANNTIIDKGDYRYLFQTHPNGNTGLGLYNPSMGWKYSAGTVPTNQWVHVAVTMDVPNNTVVFYLNGNILSTHNGVSVPAPDNGAITIGMQQPSSCNCNNFDGKMDELRVWSRTLSQCEIINNMNCEINPVGQTGLAALYRFNQGYLNVSNAAVATLTDLSGSGNTGTLTNFALTSTTSNWTGGYLGNANTPSCSAVTAVSINTQPTNTSTCAGINTQFTVAASGSNLNYEWQVNTGSGFAAISNTTFYSGFTTNTLTVIAPIAGMNAYQYRVVVKSAQCPTLSFTSNVVTLTVNTSPVITVPPVATVTCEGSNTFFSVTATGAALTYQWQVNIGSGFADIANTGVYTNANTSTLNITGALASMNNYTYRCVIGGTCTPSVTSTVVSLTVRTLPTVTTQPSNVTLCAGATATFTIAATGSGISYQWQENQGSGWANVSNGGVYFNAQTATLSIVPTNAGLNGYQYRCVVSGLCTPAAISNAATLTVNTAPTLSLPPFPNQIICAGGNTSFSVLVTGTSLAYQWQLSTNGGSSWSNLTNTGVYTNVTTSAINITGALSSMNGSLYRCVVSGTCTPSLTTPSGILTVNTLPAVVSQPSNVTVCANGNISFTVGATGTSLTYQWQQDPGTGFVNLSNGGAVTGATSATLNIVAVTTGMNNYNYRCVISGACTPAVTTNNAVLTVNPIIASSVSIAASATAICSGTSVTFTATPTNGGASPVYQWYRGGSPVGTNSPTYTASNFLNGEVMLCQMTSNASCIASNPVASNSVTMNVTQSVTPSLQITTPFNPVCNGTTVVFTAVPTNGGSSPAYQWRKNGNPVGTGATTYTDNTLVNGDIISCVLTSNAVCATTTTANSNNITMGINPIVTPLVTITTTSTSRCAGQSTTFTATPTNGGTSPTYQWQVNGFAVGTNSNTYTTTTLNNGDVVNCVMISNAPCPSPYFATSNSLTMTIIPLVAPTISISSNFGTQACQNVATTFTAVITNGGSAPLYQWRRNGSPVGTNSPTYVAPTLNNGDIITCILASSATCATPSSVTSNSLTMTVNPVGKATVSASASPDTLLCIPAPAGVLFYSNYTNGGSTPSFQWRINGTDVPGATNATFFTTALKDMDAVSVRFSSSALCVFPEVSTPLTMHAYPRLALSVNITMTNVGPNTTQFTALITNGGASPKIQWLKNEKPVPGETGLTYTTSGLTSSDRISVEVVSNAICATPQQLTSNFVTVTTGIHNVEHAGLKFGLYPNPVSTDKVYLTSDKTLRGETIVRLINKLGQLVSEHKVTITTGTPSEIVIGDVAAGTYYLQVINTTENIKTNIKFDKN